MAHSAAPFCKCDPTPTFHELVPVLKRDRNASENIYIPRVISTNAESFIGFLLGRAFQAVNSDFIDTFGTAENFPCNSLTTTLDEIF